MDAPLTPLQLIAGILVIAAELALIVWLCRWAAATPRFIGKRQPERRIDQTISDKLIANEFCDRKAPRRKGQKGKTMKLILAVMKRLAFILVLAVISGCGHPGKNGKVYTDTPRPQGSVCDLTPEFITKGLFTSPDLGVRAFGDHFEPLPTYTPTKKLRISSIVWLETDSSKTN